MKTPVEDARCAVPKSRSAINSVVSRDQQFYFSVEIKRHRISFIAAHL